MSRALIVVLVLLTSRFVSADEPPKAPKTEQAVPAPGAMQAAPIEDQIRSAVKVLWDFGSGPGKTSNFYVGEREVPVVYATAGCHSRFTLEEVRYEFSYVMKDGKSVPGGPPFLSLKIRKHFPGDFNLLPEVTIKQNRVDSKGKVTWEKEQFHFPFRQKMMARDIEDWTRSEIDVNIAAPAAVVALEVPGSEIHNPLDWAEIGIACE